MLTRKETIEKLRSFKEKFTRDIEYRDNKPHEYLDTFVDYDMIEGALHHLENV